MTSKVPIRERHVADGPAMQTAEFSAAGGHQGQFSYEVDEVMIPLSTVKVAVYGTDVP